MANEWPSSWCLWAEWKAISHSSSEAPRRMRLCLPRHSISIPFLFDRLNQWNTHQPAPLMFSEHRYYGKPVCVQFRCEARHRTSLPSRFVVVAHLIDLRQARLHDVRIRTHHYDLMLAAKWRAGIQSESGAVYDSQYRVQIVSNILIGRL